MLATRKSGEKRLRIPWNHTPFVVPDGTRIDLRLEIPDSLRQALVGRRVDVEWVQLDENYDPKGGARQARAQIHPDSEDSVGVEDLNLRLSDTGTRRGAPAADHAKPPGRPGAVDFPDPGVRRLEVDPRGQAPRLLPRHPPGAGPHRRRRQPREGGDGAGSSACQGSPSAGWHNDEHPAVSGVHLTAIGNVLEALSTDNSIAVSLGLAFSLYKDRFLFGFAWDIYDSRPRARREGTRDYILTFKYSGLF